MKPESIRAIHEAYDIEQECIAQMKAFIDDEAFSKAVDLLSNAPRIGTAGCGHSGIMCQHFAHLMCCIDRPARFISPAEAVHGAMGFLQAGGIGADICASAIELSAKIQRDDAVSSPDYPDQLPLGFSFPTTHALPLRDLLLHSVSLLVYTYSLSARSCA